jgi:hypothetical protein
MPRYIYDDFKRTLIFLISFLFTYKDHKTIQIQSTASVFGWLQEMLLGVVQNISTSSVTEKEAS